MKHEVIAPKLKIYEPPKLSDIDLTAIHEYIQLKMVQAYMEGVNRGVLFVVENDRVPDIDEKAEMRRRFEER